VPDEKSVDVRKRVEALGEVRLAVYVEAYAENDGYPGPRWARFTYDRALLLRLLRLADVVRAEKLEAALDRREPAYWSDVADEQDPRMLIAGGSIEVTGTEFRFLARSQHVDTRVVTSRVSLEDLLRAGEGPPEAQTPTYERRGHVLVYAKDSDRKAFIVELQEMGETPWAVA
jgi:hypothetical protein